MTRPTFLSLFAGVGGLDLGLERVGWRCVGQVEIDPYCQAVLARHWPDVPRYGDIREVDFAEVERVDLVAGGFPCQPVSAAGKRLAQADARWLWPEFVRAIRILRPRYVLIENVPGLLTTRAVEEPNDRCLCGWPCGWGGLRLRRQGERRHVLRATGRRRDDGEGEWPAAVVAGHLWRGGADQPAGDGAMGRSAVLVDHRSRSSTISPHDPAASPSEDGASPARHSSRGDQAVAGAATVRSAAVDGRGTAALRDAAASHPGVEPQRTGDAGSLPGWESLCPACGRDLGDAPTRLVLRSGLSDVLGDLAAVGYDAAWGCLRAADVGAPHRRERVFVIAVLAHGRGPGRVEQRWPEPAAPQEPAAQRRGAVANPHRDRELEPSGFLDQERERAGDRGTPVADPLRAGGRQDGRGALGDEGPDEGWPAQHDHQPRGDGEGRNGQALADPEGPGRCWTLGNDPRPRPPLRPERPARPDGRAGDREPQPRVGRGPDGLPGGLDRDRPAHRWPAPPGPQHDWEPPRTAPRVPKRAARLKALGNAVVPQVAEHVGRLILDAWDRQDGAA